MVIARYVLDWQYLSKEHEKIDVKLAQILNDYARDQLQDHAWTVIGTFGVGKTQLLYHVFKCAKAKGLLPLFFIAEDLFREVIGTKDKVFTPGDVYTLMMEKVQSLIKALSEGYEEEARKIVDPRGKLKNDSPELLDALNEFSNSDLSSSKVVLLVDELEGQYGVLQDKVQTRDRSPLREWLESRNYLKFLAFAPAGIYELGGADRDRVKRIVLPPADIDYIRENLIRDPGRSNSCWWLSRGKPRQLFKACEVLKEKGIVRESDRVFRIIKDELDSIGQKPTQVPPAVTDAVSPSKIPFLLNLHPMEGEKARRYVLDTNALNTGELADKLVEAFSLNKDNAVLISEYFNRTVRTLSSEEGIVYIDDKDLPELFCLVYDHLLEYEHGSPELSETLGEILNLYEKVEREEAALYGIIGRLWELKESKWQLPLSIGEIRKAFPFPTMNPMVKNHIPAEMRKKWEGKGLPIWKWIEGDIAVLFFASERDFLSYHEKDEFLSLVLPDGKGVLCLFATGEMLKDKKKPLTTWLGKNGKLKFIQLPPLVTDFLLSATGEIQGGIPGDLHLCLTNFKENKEDILLSRKSEIYSEAIGEIVTISLPKAEVYYKGVPPDAVDIWGKTKIRDRDPMVNGIALAFANLKREEIQMLADLRELFKGGREGRGTGDLHGFMPSGGLPTLTDDLLPRYGTRKELKDSEPISRLSIYWRDDERDRLVELAHILPLDDFLKLHPDEDMNRVLEALWRVVRNEFDYNGLDSLTQDLEKEVLPVLRQCEDLEQDGIKNFGLSGMKFEDYETLVKSKGSFEKLLEIAKESTNPERSISPLPKYVVNLLMSSLDIKSDIRKLESLSNTVMRALEELANSRENLKKNFWEYPKATKFLATTEDKIKAIAAEQSKMDGTPTLQQLEKDARERKQYLDEVSTSLSDLNRKLTSLENIWSGLRGAE